jgi:hypothetical protein
MVMVLVDNKCCLKKMEGALAKAESALCKGMAIDNGRHLKSCQWITPETMLLTKVQIHYLHLNYIYYIRLVCALL